jgi:hypothetical protein
MARRVIRITLGNWFLWERGIRLRIGKRQWWFAPDPPWEEKLD